MGECSSCSVHSSRRLSNSCLHTRVPEQLLQGAGAFDFTSCPPGSVVVLTPCPSLLRRSPHPLSPSPYRERGNDGPASNHTARDLVRVGPIHPDRTAIIRG